MAFLNVHYHLINYFANFINFSQLIVSCKIFDNFDNSFETISFNI